MRLWLDIGSFLSMSVSPFCSVPQDMGVLYWDSMSMQRKSLEVGVACDRRCRHDASRWGCDFPKGRPAWVVAKPAYASPHFPWGTYQGKTTRS